MDEFYRRLFHTKRLCLEIFTATFFVNLLSLASPIFVIQILSRYIGYGFDGTLVTLTGGMLIALALTHQFVLVRSQMAEAINSTHNTALQLAVHEMFTKASPQALQHYPKAKLHELASAPQKIQATYTPGNFVAILDLPFFILFFFAVFFISPLLAIVTLAATTALVTSTVLNFKSYVKEDQEFQAVNLKHRDSLGSAISGIEQVRLFSAHTFVLSRWERQLNMLSDIKRKMQNRGTRKTAVMQSVSSLLRVSVYAVGAKLAVMGDISVGSLIGVSIIASKALQIGNSFAQAYVQVKKNDATLLEVKTFLKLPVVSETGIKIDNYSGQIELSDLGFTFTGSSTPLFESLNLKVSGGALVAITGFNGAGKSTLATILCGLKAPTRGNILVGGVNLSQVDQSWWNTQLMYLPQEPAFFSGSIYENITTNKPPQSDIRLDQILSFSGLKKFIDSSPEGLGTMIREGGRNIPVGIRKRIGLARALASDGSLVIFDEPTEGLDNEGCAAVYGILNQFAGKKTIFVVTKDPNILKATSIIIDLSSKPVPTLLGKKNIANGDHDAS